MKNTFFFSILGILVTLMLAMTWMRVFVAEDYVIIIPESEEGEALTNEEGSVMIPEDEFHDGSAQDEPAGLEATSEEIP